VRTVCLLYGCHCRACCERIERAVLRVRGVQSAEANLYKATLDIEHDAACTCADFIAAIERIGYLAERMPAQPGQPSPAEGDADRGSHGGPQPNEGDRGDLHG